MVRRFKIREFQRGLCFRDGSFRGVLAPGVHWLWDPFLQVKVERVSVRTPWIVHPDLDAMVRSGRLGDEVTVLDLRDRQRALVWLDGRFVRVVPAGLFALWNVFRTVKIEIVDISEVQLKHAELSHILEQDTEELLWHLVVEAQQVGMFFLDGQHRATLRPGVYAFWKGAGRVRMELVDQRDAVIDVTGQEILTADKVTLRLNAVVTYRVTDPVKATLQVQDLSQTLYREAQLILREVIGSRDLDRLLTDREAVTRELLEGLRSRASDRGAEVTSLGIRDVILPGDMKDLLNKVTEARKSAEAALITRREETAAMRSQANTARILENSPTLMRLRELEVLEKIAGTSSLSVILGEKGLADRVTKLI